jgi:hypothetical protein
LESEARKLWGTALIEIIEALAYANLSRVLRRSLISIVWRRVFHQREFRYRPGASRPKNFADV